VTEQGTLEGAERSDDNVSVIDFTCEGEVADFNIRFLGYLFIDPKDFLTLLFVPANNENLGFLDLWVDPQHCSNREGTCPALVILALDDKVNEFIVFVLAGDHGNCYTLKRRRQEKFKLIDNAFVDIFWYGH
jgi:hypothetical protein